jgi:hypothetical protein
MSATRSGELDRSLAGRGETPPWAGSAYNYFEVKHGYCKYFFRQRDCQNLRKSTVGGKKENAGALSTTEILNLYQNVNYSFPECGSKQ